jgi:hypothetical protein
MHIGRPTLAGFLRTRFQWTTLALIRMDSSACSSALEAVCADAPFGAASVAPRASGAGVLPGEKTITEGLKFALQQKHLVFRLAKDISGKLVCAGSTTIVFGAANECFYNKVQARGVLCSRDFTQQRCSCDCACCICLTALHGRC